MIPLILLGVKEVITGILMGFMLNFIFYGFSYAGLLIGYDMGLAMAQMFDPTTESNTNIMGQVMLIMATLIFLLINGHHYLIRALVYSFSIVPIGTFEMNQGVMDLIIRFSAGIFVLAVKIASPIMVSFFLLHLGSGIVARVMPQMNIFFVVQPLKSSLGLVLLITLTPVYVYVIRDLLMAYEDKLLELIKAISG
jgi:flagellar biosynthetic protein FliR